MGLRRRPSLVVIGAHQAPPELCRLSEARVNLPHMGAKKTDDGSSIVWGILLFLGFMVVAWPYLLGTWVDVPGCGVSSGGVSVVM